MTRTEAIAAARRLADEQQVWYEVHTNGERYIVVKGRQDLIGYWHDISISPNVKVNGDGRTN
jgi:hypothetical protein